MVIGADAASVAVTRGDLRERAGRGLRLAVVIVLPGSDLAFSEFKGHEGWQVVSLSRSDKALAAILARG